MALELEDQSQCVCVCVWQRCASRALSSACWRAGSPGCAPRASQLTSRLFCPLSKPQPKQCNRSSQLVWLKLVRNEGAARDRSPDEEQSPLDTVSAPLSNAHDITLLSLNKRTITPDKRFKVSHQSPSKWTLTIENVSLSDDKAYYLCQVGGGSGGSGGGGLSVGRSGSRPPASEHAGSSATPRDPMIGSSDGLNFVGGARLNVLGEFWLDLSQSDRR